MLGTEAFWEDIFTVANSMWPWARGDVSVICRAEETNPPALSGDGLTVVTAGDKDAPIQPEEYC